MNSAISRTTSKSLSEKTVCSCRSLNTRKLTPVRGPLLLQHNNNLWERHLSSNLKSTGSHTLSQCHSRNESIILITNNTSSSNNSNSSADMKINNNVSTSSSSRCHNTNNRQLEGSTTTTITLLFKEEVNEN